RGAGPLLAPVDFTGGERGGAGPHHHAGRIAAGRGEVAGAGGVLAGQRQADDVAQVDEGGTHDGPAELMIATGDDAGGVVGAKVASMVPAVVLDHARDLEPVTARSRVLE